MLLSLAAIALACIVIERLWPANALPVTRGWWFRIALVNAVQLGMVLLASRAWDIWFARASLVHLREQLGDISSGLIAYFVSTFIYYWWHRFRHESAFFWRVCHQLHHSPRRIELLTSFYKHPVEILLNSLLSSAIVFLLLGCSATAASIYTFCTAVAEYFYHWNIRTPHWLGFIVQRPESHRVHHQLRHHTNNFADLPIWDLLFGTLRNPTRRIGRCGFDADREQRFAAMLTFRDVHAPAADQRTATPGRLPTCFGCRKRWVCARIVKAAK